MLSAIGKLLPFVMLITEFVKEQLGVKGKLLMAISWVVSLIGAGVYGLSAELALVEIILLGIATGVSANGGYDLIQEIVKYIKE